MVRPVPTVVLTAALFFSVNVARAQRESDAFQQAMAQGDLYASKHKYELALDAYHKADKAAHHESASCYLMLASVERKLGDFSSALDDTKKAIKAAGNDKEVASKAHTMRAILLVRQSSKPTDKKLKEAEDDMRQVITLDSQQALAHFNLGTILLKQDRDADGIAELNQALALHGLDDRSTSEAKKFIASPIRAREPFAPDFDFVTKESQRMSNASLRGKVVLMDFWGTWCPPCRESIPTTKNVYKKYQSKGLEVIGVSSDDDEDVWRTFVEAQKMDWHEYIDLSGNVINAFDVDSYPTYVVLDKDGVIRFRQSGFGPTTEGELEDAIGRALKRSSDPALAKAAVAASESPKMEAREASNRASNSTAISEKTETASAGDSKDVPFGIEAFVVSGNTYKNEALSLTYDFPKGWTAQSATLLHAANAKSESAAVAALLQQHPEAAQHLNIMMPKGIFYASKSGQGNWQQLDVPCIRISATPARIRGLSLDTFQKMADSMATASSAKLTGPASKFEVKDHEFARADFERAVGGMKLYQAYVQTLSEDYLLTIEIFAKSSDELQKIAETLQTMVIADE